MALYRSRPSFTFFHFIFFFFRSYAEWAILSGADCSVKILLLLFIWGKFSPRSLKYNCITNPLDLTHWLLPPTKLPMWLERLKMVSSRVVCLILWIEWFISVQTVSAPSKISQNECATRPSSFILTHSYPMATPTHSWWNHPHHELLFTEIKRKKGKSRNF